MARASKKKPWDAAFRRIRCVYDARCLPVPKPNAADLDAVGEQLGIDFPASYRAFAQEFGLDGDLGGLPEVLPLTHTNRSWHTDGGGSYDPSKDWWNCVVSATHAMRSHHQEYFDELADTAPPGFADRLVLFALDSKYDYFVFDPADVTNKRWRECRIYDVGQQGHTEAIADSFPDWLAWIEQTFRSDHGDEVEDWPFPYVVKPDSTVPRPVLYQRSSVRLKNAPNDDDVRRWLAWNNGAVLGLARSLRDDRTPNTFPVLADALEEAGCDNEDVLASCRTGDPDVDGAWALFVLLDATK